MKALSLLCIVMLLCFGYSKPVAAQVTPANAILMWGRDCRIVRDAAALRFHQFTDEQSWILAEVKPDADSYGGRAVGVHFDKTGKLVQEPGIRHVTIISVHGSIKPIIILVGKPQMINKYGWEFEKNVRFSNVDETESYPIFRIGPGGTAVFRINEQAEGAAKFSPAYLLADELTPFVAPALKYVQANKELFDLKAAPEHQAKLQQLLIDENPFIAIAAARVLMEARLLDTSSVKKMIANATDLRQSVFVYLVFKELPSPKRTPWTSDTPPTPEEFIQSVRKALEGEPLTQEISKIIGAAKDAETLKSLAMGLIALIDNSPQGGIYTSERVNLLMRQVAERQVALNTHTKADLYLDQTLKLMGLKKEPENAKSTP